MKKFSLLAPAVIMAILGLAGCGSTSQGEPSAQSKASASAAEENTPEPLDEPTLTDAPPTSDDDSDDSTTDDDSDSSDGATDPVKFGQGFTYTDGLGVKVSKPVPYRPGEYAVKRKGDTSFVKFTVTVTNHTGKLFDATQVSTSGTTGQREAEEVFDDTVGGGLDTKMLPGQVSHFDIAYGVVPKTAFVLQVEPGYTADDESYDSALFTS